MIPFSEEFGSHYSCKVAPERVSMNGSAIRMPILAGVFVLPFRTFSSLNQDYNG